MTAIGDERDPPAVVLDTSVVINLKKNLKVTDQWGFFERLTILVAHGLVGWPRYVRKEIIDARHPDAPGAWIAGQNAQPFPEPAFATLAEVLGAAQLVDAEAEDEVADPYVVAMGLELRVSQPERRVVIASDDVVDRMPQKESIATACERLSLERWSCHEFIEWAQSVHV
ncbi:MAG TPA: DUF4411 family protein [Frankiaceae bacterium]|nr:DUF4411 family protein [Frankiaceae bacterium]